VPETCPRCGGERFLFRPVEQAIGGVEVIGPCPDCTPQEPRSTGSTTR
jgi:hypothetical protein